jgi:DNA (cytosine-5)-methyltransferase 1
MRVLNLYAGIGGNRKLWTDVEVTAVEMNPDIARIYQDFFPNDKVVIGDAHQYLLEHFSEFDFIWASPPCPTHSITRFMQTKKVYPDMTLWQEIVFLKQWATGKFCVENVIPYYEPLVKPDKILHRHCFWTNFTIVEREFPKMETCKKLQEREFLQEALGFNIDKYEGVDKRKLLRNCVLPELGLHVFNNMKNLRESTGELFAGVCLTS